MPSVDSIPPLVKPRVDVHYDSNHALILFTEAPSNEDFYDYLQNKLLSFPLQITCIEYRRFLLFKDYAFTIDSFLLDRSDNVVAFTDLQINHIMKLDHHFENISESAARTYLQTVELLLMDFWEEEWFCFTSNIMSPTLPHSIT